jgi:hypothetical protein
MTNTKKIITVALAAVAITTASLASTGSANASGRHGHFFHHHHHYRGVFFATPVYASCWKWVFFKGYYKKVYVCGY